MVWNYHDDDVPAADAPIRLAIRAEVQGMRAGRSG